MSQSLNIYIAFHASFGEDVVFEFPFSAMKGEMEHHAAMFPDAEGITQELYRRLQVRATLIILNMCAGQGGNEYLYPRNYFVHTQKGTDTEIDQLHKDCIPIVDTDIMYNRHFQVFMLPNKAHIQLFPIDTYHKLVTMTIPDEWTEMDDDEKEYEWESQIKVCFDELYETHHVMG
jgi:hypothetical protein